MAFIKSGKLTGGIVSKTKPLVVIGNSAAGLSAIKAVRKAGDTSPIVLVSRENCLAYSPVLTTYYIGGQIERAGMFLVDEGFYRRLGVQTLLGRQVMEINPEGHMIQLDNRRKMTYGRLLIATGASAKILDEVDPEARSQVATLRTMTDAEDIKNAVAKAKDLVVTGAGLVSLQTIKAVMGRGIRITAVIGSHQILSQQMDSESAALIRKKLETQGINLLFGRQIKSVIRHGQRIRVKTNYHEILPADLLVVGKGVTPNVRIAREAGLQVKEGILIDDTMRTSAQDIYAAGDVAQGRNSLTGKPEVIATWFNACAQGEVAGFNMAGRPAVRRGQFRENVTNLMGIAVASLGLSNPEPGELEEISYVDEERIVGRKLFFDGSVLSGAVLINRLEDAGVIRACIANRMDLTCWKADIARKPLHFGRILGPVVLAGSNGCD